MTEWRELQERLRREIAEKEAVLNAIADEFSLKDLSLRFIWANQPLLDRVGKTLEEAIGTTCHETTYRLTEPCENCPALKAIETGTGVREVIKAKDGRWREVSVEPVELDGEIIGVIELSRDVTAQVVYEENLAALHSHAVRLNSVDSVEGVAKATLEIMEQVLGEGFISFQVVEEGFLVHVDARGLEPPVEPLPLNGMGVTVRAAREARTIYVPNVKDDPDYIEASSKSRSELAVPVRNDGEVIAVLNIESPIVDAFTDQDIKLLEILALHVGTSLIRLRQEREIRRISEENMSSILSGFERVTRMLRHDLRSPLQSINNAAQMMELDPSKTSEMLTIIRNNVKYITEVLNDLRTMTTTRTLIREPLDVDILIRRLLNRRILPNDIEVDLGLQSGVKVRVDRTKLTRVIDNLINNAVEAMPQGGKLTLETRVEGDDYVIMVGDDGEGISEEDLSMIFRPFFSTKETGMGLGLTYCKEVVEAHGGSIGIASKKGVGTKVTVRLPRGSGG